MTSFLFYLAGFLTPILFFAAFQIAIELADWKNRRRYKKAYEKFTTEFDQLTPFQLADCRAIWDKDKLKYSQYCDDKDRYFALKWQHGYTTEI
jgi:hypothetical protein